MYSMQRLLRQIGGTAVKTDRTTVLKVGCVSAGLEGLFGNLALMNVWCQRTL